MEYDFNLPGRYYTQADIILREWLQNQFPRKVSMDEITEDLIRSIEGYKVHDIFIELCAIDIINNRSIEWSMAKELMDPGEDFAPETLRRLKWLYKNKKEISFDKYFIARIMKVTEDVYGEIVIRDYL